jgi:hypothetical protein
MARKEMPKQQQQQQLHPPNCIEGGFATDGFAADNDKYKIITTHSIVMMQNNEKVTLCPKIFQFSTPICIASTSSLIPLDRQIHATNRPR